MAVDPWPEAHGIEQHAAFTDDVGAELLRELVVARCNIVIAGATSSGKTLSPSGVTIISFLRRECRAVRRCRFRRWRCKSAGE
ncbi:MAG: Flp pilus assembly complex ATPase component TadA [Aquincola sp.]|nr:Flp pilus assembly complex ATPase component TadA [Aquincola sp.]